tara:strand:+ start:501 stop:749 length:249 start_codon:yes stop_codon:yes gene_type:complete
MGLINMNNKTSVIRPVIEDIWQTNSLNEAKIKLRELMSNVTIIGEMQKRRLLLDIGNCQSKEKLDQIATNCMLKFEGLGVIA